MRIRKFFGILLMFVGLQLITTYSASATEVKITRAALDFLKENCKIQSDAIVLKNESVNTIIDDLILISEIKIKDPQADYVKNVLVDDNWKRVLYDEWCDLFGVWRESESAIYRNQPINSLFYYEGKEIKCILITQNELDNFSQIQLNPLSVEPHVCWITTVNDIISLNLELVSGKEARGELLN